MSLLILVLTKISLNDLIALFGYFPVFLICVSRHDELQVWKLIISIQSFQWCAGIPQMRPGGIPAQASFLPPWGAYHMAQSCCLVAKLCSTLLRAHGL